MAVISMAMTGAWLHGYTADEEKSLGEKETDIKNKNGSQ